MRIPFIFLLFPSLFVACSSSLSCGDDSTLSILRDQLLQEFGVPNNIYDYHKRGLIFFEQPIQIEQTRDIGLNMCQALVVVAQADEFRIVYSTSQDNAGTNIVKYEKISSNDSLRAKKRLGEELAKLKSDYEGRVFLKSHE